MLQIRRFRLGEEPALFGLYHSAIHLVACQHYSPAQIDAWAPGDVDPQAWAVRIQGIDPFVAKANGQLVGYADVQADGYIDHFFVSGHRPRQGIGRALMSRLHDEAARLGVKRLSSDVSLTAQPFFAHFGFEVVEQRAPVRRGVALPNARMIKPLTGVGGRDALASPEA